MSNDAIIKKMGVSEFTNVFAYVSLSCRQHQQGACKYKKKKIKHTCILPLLPSIHYATKKIVEYLNFLFFCEKYFYLISSKYEFSLHKK